MDRQPSRQKPRPRSKADATSAQEKTLPRVSLVLALLLGFHALFGYVAPSAAASCIASRLDPGERVFLKSVGPSGTLLTRDGQEIRLAGISLPDIGQNQTAPDPSAQDARRALNDLAANKTFLLYHGHARRDRYDRLLAHPCGNDGTWVQGKLLDLGLAWVATTRGEVAMATEMLEVEKRARTNRLGIWAETRFRVRNPHETRRDIDTFQIVEGRVVSAAVIKGRAYLNFGPNWRTDFTFSRSPRDRRRFERAGIDLATLASRRVRGRGWVTLRNSPLIELTHPEQLEILGE
jgi:micrococcal nuclease